MITDRFEAAVSEFVRTEFGNKHLSINNQEDILWAVEKAYQDMMPRTIKGHEIKVKEHCTKKLRENYLQYSNKEVQHHGRTSRKSISSSAGIS